MSTILVVQPYRMLQQAMILALPVEHRIRMMETLPDAGVVAAFDAVIIDAAALLEKGALAVDGLSVRQVWQAPTLWITEGDKPAPPSLERLVILQKPVQRESLQKGLEACLSSAGGEMTTGTVSRPKNKDKKKAKERSGASGKAEPEIIELVEVVEEASAPDENHTQEN